MLKTPLTTGGKKRKVNKVNKVKKVKKVKKVSPNPFKKLLNSLSFRKQKKGKKIGGEDQEYYDRSTGLY